MIKISINTTYYRGGVYVQKVILGLDMGVASVGWSLLDKDTGEILGLGSRLFNSATASENEDRRNFRGTRRLNRRKRHRRERVKNLLEKENIAITDMYIDENPYAIRVKGLTHQLSTSELYAALYHLVKHRGISYLDDVAEEEDIKIESLKINAKELKKKHPCEIQLERFNTYGKVRGIIEVGNQQTLVNIFPTSAYQKEAEALLDKQADYYPQITQEFIGSYIKILVDKRSYFIGPGNHKSRTDYGVYRTNGETWDNLFEILIGKCSIYPEELRAAKASYTAQEFNILNDLNNITIRTLEEGKLSKEQKEKIITVVKQSNVTNMMNIIAKVVGCKKDDIDGYRVNKKGKPEFHSFEIYRKVKKALLAEDITEELSQKEFDELAHILTINTETLEIERKIHLELPHISQKIISVLIELNKKNTFSSWHSLSIKAMKQMIPELYETSKNQMQIVTAWGIQKPKYTKYKDMKYIPEDSVLEDIYNPIATRSIRQTIKVINALLKEHQDKQFDSIVIEMPRDFISSKDEKSAIEKIQKENEKQKKDAILRAKLEYNFDDNAFNNHKKLALKLRLWYQQNQRCIYSGKVIKVIDLVNNPNLFDIDHIIPVSISLDDSLSNKVLCYAEENRIKGQRTPYRYLKSKKSDWIFEQYKSYVLELFNDGKGKINKTKMDFLLMEEDINKWEVRRGFVARNLVDTRYASKVLLNTLQDFFVAHNRETKVKVVRGKFISQLRNGWRIHKNRDESYSHHAIDATLIAVSANLKVWKQDTELDIHRESGTIFNRMTGEVVPLNKISTEEYEVLSKKEPYHNFKKQITDIIDGNSKVKVKYSHMVSKKVNRKISDATIYSTREIKGKDIVVAKISNIYDDASYQQFKKRYDKDKTQFLMYQHDPKTFKILESIIETYKDVKNPFAEYKEEHGHIKKYSKKGNGAIIKNLKYFDKVLGQHIDISTKNKIAPPKTKKVVLLSVTPYRADVFKCVETGQYTIVGIKYGMFTFSKGGYELKQDKYKAYIEEQGVTNHHTFCFSLYRGDIIEFGEDKNSLQQFRFWSRNESGKNRLEVKPIDIPNYEKRALGLKTITKNIRVFNKYNTSVLGEMYQTMYEMDPRTLK